MNAPVVRMLDAIQLASMLALVAVFIRPQAPWSLRARLPVALVVFVSSAALLILRIL